MRARNIKPSFFKNEFLAECDPLARLLFIGLWCAADKNGFIEYRPKRLKIEILPYDSCNLTELLESLSNYGFITIWCKEVDGSDPVREFIEVDTFLVHQKPHVNEYDSGISDLLSLHETSSNYVKLSVTTCRKSLNDECGMMNDECGIPRKPKRKVKQKIPSIEAVKSYFIENGYTEDSAIKAFEYYKAGDWTDSKGNPVLNWKQKMRIVWFKDENKVRNLNQKTLEEQLS